MAIHAFEVAQGIAITLSGKVSDQMWALVADTQYEADVLRWKHECSRTQNGPR